MKGHYAIILGRVNRYGYHVNNYMNNTCSSDEESRLRLKIMNLKDKELVEFDNIFLRHEEVWEGYLPFDVLEIGDEIIVPEDITHRIIDVTRHVDGSVIYKTNTVSQVEYTKESEEEKIFYNKLLEGYKEEIKETEEMLDEILDKKRANIFRRILNKFKQG